MTPYLVDLSPAMLCFGIFLFNIVGHIPGAAVAQMTFTNKIFGPILLANGVPPVAVTAVLLSSSQVDWFGPFPSSDMFGQMGLARSNQLKYMLYGGWAICCREYFTLRGVVPNFKLAKSICVKSLTAYSFSCTF